MKYMGKLRTTDSYVMKQSVSGSYFQLIPEDKLMERTDIVQIATSAVYKDDNGRNVFLCEAVRGQA